MIDRAAKVRLLLSQAAYFDRQGNPAAAEASRRAADRLEASRPLIVVGWDGGKEPVRLVHVEPAPAYAPPLATPSRGGTHA